MLGHLKLHTVGDVDLSHYLGIDFECARCEYDFDNNADGWYD
jgi:lipocalin